MLTAGPSALAEDVLSGAQGWLSGVSASVKTWQTKLAKAGVPETKINALLNVAQAAQAASAALAGGVREAADQPKGPSKADRDKLVQAYAIYLASGKSGSGATIAQQKGLYDKYSKALNKVLDKLGAQTLSPENQAELDAAAQKWLNTQGIRGPGKWW